MADKTAATFKRGDRFAYYYKTNPAVTGRAPFMVAQARADTGADILATLTIEESETTPGLYFIHTAADTTEWPDEVRVDVWHTDIERHDPDTLVFTFIGGITYV